MKVMLLLSASVLALAAGNAGGRTTLPIVAKSAIKALHFTPHNGSTILYDQAQTSGFWLYAVASVALESSGLSVYDTRGADDFVLPKGRHRINAVYAPGVNAYGTGYGATRMNVIFYRKISREQNVTTVKVLKSCPSSPNADLTGTGDMLIDVSACKVRAKGGKHDYSVSVQAITPSGSGWNNYWYWQMNKYKLRTAAWWENEGGGYGYCTTGYQPLQTCITSSAGPDLAFEIIGR